MPYILELVRNSHYTRRMYREMYGPYTNFEDAYNALERFAKLPWDRLLIHTLRPGEKHDKDSDPKPTIDS